jgi:hypothetical protein
MIKPALAQFASSRSEELPLPGNYDESQSVWLAPTGEPLISLSELLPELRTKTDTVRERDDTSNYHLLELMTKTTTIRERDDK